MISSISQRTKDNMDFSKPLVVKATYQGDTRRFVEYVGQDKCPIGFYEQSTSTSSLVPDVDPVVARARRELEPEFKVRKNALRLLEKALRHAFNITPESGLKLTYKDVDGDTITLGGFQDLEDALELQKLNPLRLEVSVVNEVQRRPCCKAEGQLSDGIRWKVNAKKDCTKLKIFHRPGLSFRGKEDEKIDARFVKDDSFPDGAIVRPGEIFSKVWTMRNTGDMSWPASTSLIRVGGDNLIPIDAKTTRIGKEFVPLNLLEDVKTGCEPQIRIALQAPTEPGRYTAYFRLGYPITEKQDVSSKQLLQDGEETVESGAIFKRFGHRIWCQVNVVPEGGTLEAVTAATKTGAPKHTSHISGFQKPIVRAVILSFLSDLRAIDLEGKVIGTSADAMELWAEDHPFFASNPKAKESLATLTDQIGSIARSDDPDTMASMREFVCKHELNGPSMRDLVHTILVELNLMNVDGTMVATGVESLDDWFKNHPFFCKGERGHKGIKALKRQVTAFLETRGEGKGDEALKDDTNRARNVRLALPIVENPVNVDMDVNHIRGFIPTAMPVRNDNVNDADKEWVDVQPPKVKKSG